MSVFRLAIIIAALAAIAAASVHFRWSNAHQAYLIQKQWDRHRELRYRYLQKYLELARRKSPLNLLDQLKRWNFPLQGWVPNETESR